MAKTFKQPFSGKKVTVGDGPLDLIGTREISDRFGITRGQVLRLLNAGDFPEPVAELHLGRVWNAEEVAETVKVLRKAGRVTSDGRVVPWRFTKTGARD